MRKVSKLFIYDADDDDNREQAEDRFDADDGVTPLPCRSEAQLIANLNLLKGRMVFTHVLFQTHGAPGIIWFGDNSIILADFINTGSRESGKLIGYDELFPFYTQIYFDGCNVAAEQAGANFLGAVGHAWLRRAGGQVFGWNNPGYAFWNKLPLIGGGHTLHLPITGNVVRRYFGPGGQDANPPSASDLDHLNDPAPA